jgi:2-(1,2-epoxy-1,2-dihydrophenyl)acetyl-CoA isomerase
MRALLRGSFERDLRGGLEAEGAAMQRCGATADAVEGIGAFIDHRAPRFEGR